ncbi:SMI1/KNR4 family protein [Sediminitomix flava]|uniref:SMI1-KNR4 cell-wall n=1 Tax=Sediminitomix flava TaxID=379075 RepID=A0A315Z459_SEDFL|nr:SMI1/KNR4 family protein [Sediminitomix flava]PWJ37869.1 SMI1-KNR4 cell-wall [Sediminitomix flava]
MIKSFINRLDRLREIDSSNSLFGSKRWKYGFKTISETEIQNFEKVNSISIPKEFRSFILEIGFGTAENYGAPFNGELTFCNDDDDEFPISEGSIIIAEHGCGIASYLIVKGDYYGQVWVMLGDCSTKLESKDYFEWYSNWLDSAIEKLEATD